MNPKIAVINESTVVNNEQVEQLVAALQIQVTDHFSYVWGGAELIFLPKGQPIPAGVWALVILDDSDQAGALGYHELTANGDPLGKVFAKSDLEFGTSWTVTASHELLEMLADPNINLSAEVDTSETNFYALEVCDACEDDQFGYDITIPSGQVIRVSDFVKPSWFVPADTDRGTYDHRGHVTKPLQILINGYIGLFSTSTGSWTQLTDQFENAEKEARAVPTPGHRRWLRTHRSEWKRSTAGA